MAAATLVLNPDPPTFFNPTNLQIKDQILAVCTCQTDSHLTSYLTQWSPSFGPPPDPLPSKQSFCDQPGLLADRSIIQASLVEHSQMACYLASVVPHSGDWLLALPIANCGLRLEDEAVRVAVGMRLGLTRAFPANVIVGRTLTPTAVMPWSAKKHLVGLQDTRCLTI